MKLNVGILIFATFVSSGYAEVQLRVGVTVTVTFEGDELEIKLDNPQGEEGEIGLCYPSIRNAISNLCPEGYRSFGTAVNEREIVFKLNRQGKLAWFENWEKLKIIFEPDGSLKIMLAWISSTMKVSLPNAELFAVTTTTMLLPKAEDSKSMTGIICVIGILSLTVFIIGAVLLYCWCNIRRHQSIPTIVPVEEARPKRVESEESLRQKAMNASPAYRPKSMRSTPLPSASSTTTKPPSTSTTKQCNAFLQKPPPTPPLTPESESEATEAPPEAL